ncbi:MAG: aminotransferase class I/II-fold pyridoxal phosphate-dependent enzyme, partial [Gammaproteobacteria bacterium]
ALQHDLAPLIRSHDNLLLLRTFSKGYSLAGLRLGYLIGAPGLIDPIISKTRDSYNIDAISQALGSAAIDARDDAAETWDTVRRDRAALAAGLAALGLHAPASQTNFLLAEVPPEAPLDARALQQALKARGILVRHFATPGLDHRLRITVGTPAQNARLLAALADLLAR